MMDPFDKFFFYRGKVYEHNVKYTILLLRTHRFYLIERARETTIYKFWKGLDIPQRY